MLLHFKEQLSELALIHSGARLDPLNHLKLDSVELVDSGYSGSSYLELRELSVKEHSSF